MIRGVSSHNQLSSVLEDAIQNGDTSVSGLLHAMTNDCDLLSDLDGPEEVGEDTAGLAAGAGDRGAAVACRWVDPELRGVTFHAFAARYFDKHFHDYRVLEAATGPAGLYVIEANWPDEAEVWVSAGFLPAGAVSRSEITTLLDFELTRTQLGRDLLATMYRSDDDTQAMVEVVSSIYNANLTLARRTIARHVAGNWTGVTVEPAMPVDPELATRVAIRPYPSKRFMDLPNFLVEDWIAHLPDGRLMVVGGGKNPFCSSFNLDYSLESWYADCADDLKFRPTDEAMDPGLRERLTAALRVATEESRPASRSSEWDDIPF